MSGVGIEIRSDWEWGSPDVPRLVNVAVACGTAVHAFFYEPWSPAVIRATGPAENVEALQAILSEWEKPLEVAPWTPVEDQEYFGPGIYDRAIGPFFEAATRVAYEVDMLTTSDRRISRAQLHTKLVHCFLNAQGQDTPDEVRFARRFAKNRAKQARKDYGLFWRWRKSKR